MVSSVPSRRQGGTPFAVDVSAAKDPWPQSNVVVPSAAGPDCPMGRGTKLEGADNLSPRHRSYASETWRGR